MTDATKALYDAVDARDLAAVRQLIADGVDVNARHPWRGDSGVLHLAVSDPVEIELVRTLLEAGADAEDRHEETGGVPLHQLLHANLPLEELLRVLDLLLSHGANINTLGVDVEQDEYSAVDIVRSQGSRSAALLAAVEARGGRPGPHAS